MSIDRHGGGVTCLCWKGRVPVLPGQLGHWARCSVSFSHGPPWIGIKEIDTNIYSFTITITITDRRGVARMIINESNIFHLELEPLFPLLHANIKVL